MLLLWLTVTLPLLTASLKQSETGRNDWALRSIGRLRSAQFIQDTIFFVAEIGMLGQLDSHTGHIKKRYELGEKESIIQNTPDSVIVTTPNKETVIYNKKAGTRQRCFRCASGQISLNNVYWANQEHVYLIGKPVGQNAEVFSVESGSKIIKLVQFDGKHALVFKRAAQICTAILPSEKSVCSKSNYIQVQDVSNLGDLLILHCSNQTILLNILTGEQVYQTDEQVVFLTKRMVNFRSHSFDLETKSKSQLKGVYCELELPVSIEQKQQHFYLLKGRNVRIQFDKPSNKVQVERSFLNVLKDEIFQLLVQYSDLQTTLYQVNSLQMSVNEIWSRQQSFAYIEYMVFVNEQAADNLDTEYHRLLQSQQYLQMSNWQKISMFPRTVIMRIRSEIEDILQGILSIIKQITQYIKSIQSYNIKQISKFTMSTDQQYRYGLRKWLIIATKLGNIFVVDSKTSSIKQKSQIPNNQMIISIITLNKAYQTQSPIIITFNPVESSCHLYQFHLNGYFQLLQSYHTTRVPTIHKLTPQSILIKAGNQLYQYMHMQTNSDPNQYYFYQVTNTSIIGYRRYLNKIIPLWNFQFNGQKLLLTRSSYNGDQVSRIPLYDEDKVFFKNVDFTNLAVLTAIQAPNSTVSTWIDLYIINGRSGQVQFNQRKKNVNINLNINMVYDEHNVIVTYYNNLNKIYQIWTIQAYQQRVETSALNMITDYLQQKEYCPESNRPNIIFTTQVYGSPVTISKLVISQSKMSLIKRNLIIVTHQSQFYSISRDLVSTRRPKENHLFVNQKYAPYAYMIPYIPTSFFSYSLRLFGIDNIQFGTTNLQSTIFIFGYGIDCFLIRMAPESNIDTIPQSFNYLVLVLIVVSMTALVFFIQYKTKQAKIKMPFIQ